MFMLLALFVWTFLDISIELLCCISCDIPRARTCYTIYMSSVEKHSSTAYHQISCHHFHHRQNGLRKYINFGGRSMQVTPPRP
jgi:hypothetical protein